MNRWGSLGLGISVGLMIGAVWVGVVGAQAVTEVGLALSLGFVGWRLISSFLPGGSSRRRGA